MFQFLVLLGKQFHSLLIVSFDDIVVLRNMHECDQVRNEFD